jgi:pyrroloquinoline-quinone synthase
LTLSSQATPLLLPQDSSERTELGLAYDTIAKIDELVRSRSVLDHPFYQAWQRGTLTRETLQDYATQYYHHVSAFPTYLSALHSNLNDIETRQVVLENLMDEERGENNHPELWLRFAEGIGADRADVLASKPSPQTETLISAFRTNTRSGNAAAGLAALYAYESQIPAVSETKKDGLQRFYGISDVRTLSYFDVHAEADVKHSRDERDALAHHITTEDDAEKAIAATDAVTQALWDLLSDIGSRHGISC